MLALWCATALAALAVIHRLFRFHAVHSLFISSVSRTDTRQQTTFKDLNHFFVPSRAVPASKWPRLVTFKFEEKGVLIQVAAGNSWGTVRVRHHTQEMCRKNYIVSGDWVINMFLTSRPVMGPPEQPNLWHDMEVMHGPARRLCQVRRFGSKRAQQLDHMIVSAVQDAEIYFKLCSTPLWLRLVYAATNALSPHRANTLVRRILWIQIRTMFFCHDTWEYRGCCRVFRILYPFFNEPQWVRDFEKWSEEYASRQFLRLNYWLGYAFLGMKPDYVEYQIVDSRS